MLLILASLNLIKSVFLMATRNLHFAVGPSSSVTAFGARYVCHYNAEASAGSILPFLGLAIQHKKARSVIISSTPS